jgi:DNA-directed RNA polymerase specialized sigma24 family protein
VFLLVSLEVMPYKVVCQILNVPLGAMLAHLHSARKQMAQELNLQAVTPVTEMEYA